MSQGATANQPRVLAVEDNAALAAVLRFHLARAGLDVTVARNGREAWNLLAQHDFALVITDQQMPEMSGEEMCGLMRNDPRLAKIPVIMVTAKSLELELPRIRQELGVWAVMPKPFSVVELIATVQECLASTPAAE